MNITQFTVNINVKVNEALETVGERRSYQTIAELEAGRFKKTVIYITASSGVGKRNSAKT